MDEESEEDSSSVMGVFRERPEEEDRNRMQVKGWPGVGAEPLREGGERPREAERVEERRRNE